MLTELYDEQNRLTAIIDHATGVRTDYGYDTRGQRATEQVTQGGKTLRDISYDYNAAGEMTSWHDRITHQGMSYQFDLGGNLWHVESHDSGKSTNEYYFYDSGNRLTEIRSGASQSANNLIAQYTYYDNGLRKSWTEDGVTRTFEYDAAGRVVQSEWRDDNNRANRAQWSYDLAGNVTYYKEQRQKDNGDWQDRFFQQTSYYQGSNAQKQSITWEKGDETRSQNTSTVDLTGRVTRADLKKKLP